MFYLIVIRVLYSLSWGLSTPLLIFFMSLPSHQWNRVFHCNYIHDTEPFPTHHYYGVRLRKVHKVYKIRKLLL